RMRFKKAPLLAALIFASLIAHATTPQITGTSPTSGATATAVTISGSGFGATQGSSTVAFNNVNATVSSWSDTQITASVPSTATTGPVKVTVSGVASNTNIYFNVPPPRIGSVSPATAAPGTQVTITGLGFQAIKGSSSISFNGYTPTVNSWSDTQIVAT